MKRALITGGTAGLGLEFAWQLAAREHNLVLVARDAERLEKIGEQIRAATGVDVEVMSADLSDRDDLTAIARRLTDPVDPVDVLVNNAGYGLRSAFLDNEIEAHERHLDVLVHTILVLSHAAARSMRERAHGQIINVSSVAGYTTSGTYAAAKAWVTVFTEALAVELKGTGVDVTALLPGFVRTEFHKRAKVNQKKIPRAAWLNAPRVVDQCLRDVNAGVVLSIPSRRYRAVAGFANGAPRWLIRAASGNMWADKPRKRDRIRSFFYR